MDFFLEKDLVKLENIIKKYFPYNKKLYALENSEIDAYKTVYNIEVIHIFNNRNWIDVWHNFDYLEINKFIGLNRGYIMSVMEIYRKKINPIALDWLSMEEDFIFYFTGLFYLGTVLESIKNEGWFLIIDFLDPIEKSHETLLIKKPDIKPYFSSLVERYTDKQLYLISIFLYIYHKTIRVQSALLAKNIGNGFMTMLTMKFVIKFCVSLKRHNFLAQCCNLAFNFLLRQYKI